jgi:hypothetical protein
MNDDTVTASDQGDEFIRAFMPFGVKVALLMQVIVHAIAAMLAHIPADLSFLQA